MYREYEINLFIPGTHSKVNYFVMLDEQIQVRWVMLG